MFTGIVEEKGRVLEVRPGEQSMVMRISGPQVVADAAPGESISCNGVCLTVVEHDGQSFAVDVMAETLARSSLGRLQEGSPLNLERALRADARLGGHVVQGHVDATGVVLERRPGDRWEVVRISLPESLSGFVVEKGSIAVDGVSLTVSAVGGDWFEVSLIPTTLEVTTLGDSPVGTVVNLEADVMAKYLAAQLDALLAGLEARLAQLEANR
ncbi:riboflavin synthase [Luteococcus peritonei]|uniref:Riboflavin synthase n=1 Tax=Luteococcus peritonei TaxID=88874 RepID=A0ABW4RRV2_9ACTN